MDSTLKGKNLLLKENFFFFKSGPILKMEENSRVASPVNTGITVHPNTVFYRISLDIVWRFFFPSKTIPKI